MRVILNQDVPNLGELGDVKDVARATPAISSSRAA